MKIFLRWIILLLLSPQILLAQLELPLASPKASVSHTIGFSQVSISYGSPAVKGRKIWGDLIPYGKVWRTGANEATIIEFTEKLKVEGKDVEPGKYGLFTIPGEQEWTIVLNKVHQQWGSYQYDEKQDVVRAKVKASKSSEFNERLLFTIVPLDDNEGLINILWENVKVTFKVESEVKEKVTENIKRALGEGENRWALLAEAASYYNDHQLDPAQALKYIDESIALKPYYWNYWIKGRIMASQKKYKEAAKFAQQAIETGEKNPDAFFDEDKELVKRDFENWKNK